MRNPPLTLVANNAIATHPANPQTAPASTVAALRHHLAFANGVFEAALEETTLRSAFQPIVGLCHERVIGYEALLRPSRPAGALRPDQLFAETSSLAEQIRLDRMGRLLHAVNYSLHAPEAAWLFLNVHPQVFIHGHRFGAFFETMLATSGLAAEHLVIEVLESAIEDEEQLAEGVMYYRRLGCLIALDDFGAEHSNIDRVLRLKPDIVKFDRSLLQRAACDAPARRILARLVALLHEAGIMVVIEGIETVDEALIALDSDADFGQGYLFGHPAAEPLARSIDFDFDLVNARLQSQRNRERRDDLSLQRVMPLFRDAAQQCARGTPLTEASLSLLACGEVQRTYLLDGQGRELQIALAPELLASLRRQLTPLLQTHRANWSRRPYFRAAIAHPEVIKVTPPYRSISDQRLCRTLSVTLQGPRGLEVLCCDMACEER